MARSDPARALVGWPRAGRALAVALVLTLAAGAVDLPGQSKPPSTQPAKRFRTHTDTYPAPRFESVDAWKRRASYIREHVLASAGLLPMPERTPLRAHEFGKVQHDDYSVSKVYFESLPGFLVTGNVYRPAGKGPFPAVLSAHGHFEGGRLENTPLVSGPGRAISLARQGFVVLAYDMIGFTDSRQLTHDFGGRLEALWGLSLGGLQLWNSIRALDFLESLPEVRRGAIGAAGASGGATQAFLLAAVDDRVAAVAPVNMISLSEQGGCVCENPPGLRLDTTNVEIAATIAPRPLLLVSAIGDWTSNTLEREYPAIRTLYNLSGGQNLVQAVRFYAEHNFNRDARETVYAWMAHWLQGAPAGVVRLERPFTVEPPGDLLVFHERPLPDGLLTPSELTAAWIDAARRQLAVTSADVRVRALRHALGYGYETAVTAPPRPKAGDKIVLLAGVSSALTAAVRRAGYTVRPIAFSPFDAKAAAETPHFDTYNRTQAAARVADMVAAIRANPGAPLIASGHAALAGLLAVAVAPVPLAVLDVDRFDTSSDAALLEHLYVPGLQRAGGLQTAATAAAGRVLVHDAGTAFRLNGIDVQPAPLTPAAIVNLLRTRRP